LYVASNFTANGGGSMAISLETATQLNIEVVRVIKLFHSMRQHAPRVHPGVEPGSYPILFSLLAGPQRVSLLAEHVYSDVSTVSRQVSTLVSHGLLDKVTDPQDGRACMVSLSLDGAELVQHLKDVRGEWFRQALHGWEPADAEAFSGYLRQFASSFEESKATVFHIPTPLTLAASTATFAHAPNPDSPEVSR
jgi:DNA-binding MarR family transcriptional regulator